VRLSLTLVAKDSTVMTPAYPKLDSFSADCLTVVSAATAIFPDIMIDLYTARPRMNPKIMSIHMRVLTMNCLGLSGKVLAARSGSLAMVLSRVLVKLKGENTNFSMMLINDFMLL